jgi:hypothetical protein
MDLVVSVYYCSFMVIGTSPVSKKTNSFVGKNCTWIWEGVVAEVDVVVAFSKPVRVSSHMSTKVCMPVFSSNLELICSIIGYPTCSE